MAYSSCKSVIVKIDRLNKENEALLSCKEVNDDQFR